MRKQKYVALLQEGPFDLVKKTPIIQRILHQKSLIGLEGSRSWKILKVFVRNMNIRHFLGGRACGDTGHRTGETARAR